MELLKAFLLGGLLCVLGQLLIDLTPFNITPGHILVGYVCGGVILSFLGLYQPLIDWGGAGATVPLSGFGHSLFQGVIEGVETGGLLGALGGGLGATAVGLTLAIVLGIVVATFTQPKG